MRGESPRFSHASQSLRGSEQDSEAYKATTRKHIKEWHASVGQRKHQEWLLVHIVRPDQSVAQGRLFQMKASVLDKVKADFNTDKKDRSIEVPLIRVNGF